MGQTDPFTDPLAPDLTDEEITEFLMRIRQENAAWMRFKEMWQLFESVAEEPPDITSA